MADAVIGDAAVRAAFARHESEIASLSGELLDRYEEATFVYRLCERIGTVLGENAIARLVLEDVASVLGACAGSIWLGRDDGGWEQAGSWPAGRRGEGDIHAPGLREAIATGSPWLREPATAAEPAIAVPIPGATDAAIGCIALAARASRRPYRAGDLKLLGAVAALTSAFVRNHRLSEKARRADARQREDEIARQIHRGLLPRHDPRIEGLDVSGGFRAAELVGGDFYGYVRATDESLGVAMADVSGHGVGAALYMATAKGAIQSEGRRIDSPAHLLARTNEVLLEDFSGTDVFATAVFIRFVPREGRLVFASGGHNPPLLVSRSGDAAWLASGGPALGIIPDAVYRDRTVPFGAGDMLIAYTDGLVEARDAAGRFFGIERLLSLARASEGGSAASMRDRIFEALDAHLGTGPPGDDVTLVVVRGTPRSLRVEAA
jgi:sigma-B regulation protein RsbU (phosphoserine phosphatase)